VPKLLSIWLHAKITTLNLARYSGYI